MDEPTPEASPLRLFIALPVPDAVKTALKKVQSELRSRIPERAVRWTPPEQFHLTLLFLGDTPARRVDDLISGLAPVCARLEPILLRCGGIGFFPLRGTPLVIWAGVGSPDGLLPELQRTISRAAAGFGERLQENDFSAHLTLGRARTLSRAHAALLAQHSKEVLHRRFGDWRATHVRLFRSELLADGARHVLLAEMALGQGPA